MTEEDLATLPFSHRPRLKLFLSADIVGSTAYKQPLDLTRDSPEAHAHWFHKVQGFYKTASEAFAEHFGRMTALVKAAGGAADEECFIGLPPRLWKTVGDEVIFWKELGTELQLWTTLIAWLKTIDSMRSYLADDAEGTGLGPLDVKTTVWLAEFPVRNKAVLETRSSTTPDLIVKQLEQFYRWRPDEEADMSPVADFIGSGIDVGFRIAAFASPRKMAISLDVAYILARSHMRMSEEGPDLSPFFPLHSSPGAQNPVDRLQPYYSGSEPLKGVLGGIDYPRFWISTVAAKSLEEARVALYSDTGGFKKVDWLTLSTFCERFYQDRRRFVSYPFVFGDAKSRPVPKKYLEFLVAAARSAGAHAT